MRFDSRVFCLVFAVLTSASVGNAVIYGNDDRLERYAIAHTPVLSSLAGSSAALVDSERIVAISPYWIQLSGLTHGEDQNLCPGEKFASQVVVSGCSGSLIAPNVILTAGHCTSPDKDDPTYNFCSRTFIVFDYAMHQPGQIQVTHSLNNVYRCRSVLRSEDREDGLDFALVELDRDVVDRAPVALRNSGEVGFGEELVAIGHPAGLPQKISRGAFLRAQGPIYFSANLDVSENSSGSPVFNAHTGELEGLEASGEEDYELDSAQQCYRVKVCPDNGCRGEYVTKTSAIRAALQRVGQPRWQWLLHRVSSSY